MEPRTSCPTPHFALPPVAWIASGVCAFGPLSGVLTRALEGRLNGRVLIAAIVVAGSFVLLPALAAWLSWRIAPARRFLPRFAFFAALGLVAAGHFVRAVHDTRARTAMVKTQAAQLAVDLVRREAGTDATSRPQNDVGEADSNRTETSRKLRASEQAIVDAQRAVDTRLGAAQQRYEAARRRLTGEAFFQIDGDPAEAIAVRREQVRAFAAANEALHEAAALAAFYFSSELRDRNVPEDAVHRAIDAYRAATKRKLPLINKVREADTRFASVLLEFLELAEAKTGATPETAARIEALKHRAREATESRDQLRAHLLGSTRGAN